MMLQCETNILVHLLHNAASIICGHRCRSDISRINGGFRGVGFQGMGYDVGSKFARGGTSLFWFDHRQHAGRTDQTHRDHLKCCCNDASYIPLHPQHLKH